MRIPVPPEMPEARGEGDAVVRSTLCSTIRDGTQDKNEGRYDCLRADQFPGMRQVAWKYQHHGAGKRQVTQRDPFESAKRAPDEAQFETRRRSFSYCRHMGRIPR